jgi:hypothetical protein
LLPQICRFTQESSSGQKRKAANATYVCPDDENVGFPPVFHRHPSSTTVQDIPAGEPLQIGKSARTSRAVFDERRILVRGS